VRGATSLRIVKCFKASAPLKRSDSSREQYVPLLYEAGFYGKGTKTKPAGPFSECNGEITKELHDLLTKSLS
jgi:hypothetical protein